MLIECLNLALLKEYQQEVKSAAESKKWAQAALAEQNQPLYFSMREESILPDICWDLEKYTEARSWYLNNVQKFLELKEWQDAHADEIRANRQAKGIDVDGPVAVSVRQAATFAKAGMLERGCELLWQAYEYKIWSQGLVFGDIAFHAAQLGLRDLAGLALANLMERRLRDAEGTVPAKKRRAEELIHSEPAEIAFLLGEYESCAAGIEKVLEGERLLLEVGGSLYDDHGEHMVFQIVRGLRVILDMLAGKGDPESLFRLAVRHMEMAMVWDREIEGDQSYFLRLYTLMALDILEGREPNPNPFAGDTIPPDGAVTKTCRLLSE